MKQVTLSLYQFGELTKEAQQKALDDHRYINTDDDWWNFTYDSFVDLMETLCIDVDKNSIHFNGFYCQGSGSSFAAVADFRKLVEASNNKSWLEEFPKLEIIIAPLNLSRMHGLLTNQQIQINPVVIPSTTGYSVKADLYYEIIGKRSGYPRIENFMFEMQAWFEQVIETCNNLLHKFLQETYESLTSDEQVKDYLESNEYAFTIDGEIATRLIAISQN